MKSPYRLIVWGTFKELCLLCLKPFLQGIQFRVFPENNSLNTVFLIIRVIILNITFYVNCKNTGKLRTE